ncbi:MAG TPA: NADH-quinone oxidoreductase subunit C [Planctomycetota bacterium]|nr:NADH-quinone oxidoreductase subunit C [Planctomycetota bacterium]
MSGMAELTNGRALALDAIPTLDVDAFGGAILGAVEEGQRVAALFGAAVERSSRSVRVAYEPSQAGTERELRSTDATMLYAVLAHDEFNSLSVARTRIEGAEFESLTPKCPQVHLFEREIAEQFGLRPVGHPWLKPVRYHRPWAQAARSLAVAARTSASADGAGADRNAPMLPGVTDFYRVEGDAVHEVAVGPVHAGVIEPGHFRFQCHGERVFHLEIALGYQHRGVEQALIGGPNARSIHYAETLSGDTTIAHTTAYCQVLEALAHCQKSARAQALRGIALELERLANHAGDLGALANDVGYLPTASYCGRIRGDFLNMTALLCGSRFGRGMVRPGGVGFDVDDARVSQLLRQLDAAEKDVTVAVNLLWDTPSVMARFEDTGPLPRQTAIELGIVGPAARASGLARDIRHDQPSGIFRFVQIPVSTYDSGDVLARAYVRWLEIRQSIQFIREQLRAIPAGAKKVPLGALAANSIAVALDEGWRGEVCHAALTDAEGRFARYKVVDPSFHNWPALAYALRNQEISDFPLCNKSFNLSYCGNDL